MRRLLLLRHSKAAPSQGGDDYGRTLTPSGREDAREIADEIAARGLVPDILIHSSAARTSETAEIAASRWPKPLKRVAEHGLYDATRAMILALARGLPDSVAAAMIVGHNPGIGDLANHLAGAGADEDRLRMAAKFPTSALAVLEFPVDRWDEIAPRTARLTKFLTPAKLGVGRD